MDLSEVTLERPTPFELKYVATVVPTTVVTCQTARLISTPVVVV